MNIILFNNYIKKLLSEFKKDFLHEKYNLEVEKAIEIFNKNTKKCVFFSQLYNANTLLNYSFITTNKIYNYSTFAVHNPNNFPIDLTILVHNFPIHSVHVKPGKTKWLLDGLPILSPWLVYHHITVVPRNSNMSYKLYHAILPDNLDVTHLHTIICKFKTGKYLIFQYGLIKVYHEIPSEILSIRNNIYFDSKWEIQNKKVKTVYNTTLIKKELIEKTWHPNRYIEWCLDTEEIDVFIDS